MGNKEKHNATERQIKILLWKIWIPQIHLQVTIWLRLFCITWMMPLCSADQMAAGLLVSHEILFFWEGFWLLWFSAQPFLMAVKQHCYVSLLFSGSHNWLTRDSIMCTSGKTLTCQNFTNSHKRTSSTTKAVAVALLLGTLFICVF